MIGRGFLLTAGRRARPGSGSPPVEPPIDPPVEPPPPYEGVFGPGPNAPAWEGKTVYPEELFNEPIPVRRGGIMETSNAAGFIGWQGFDGYSDPGQPQVFYDPVRITYETAETPLGTKQVMQSNMFGDVYPITAAGQTSVPIPMGQPGWRKTSVLLRGSWVGEFVAEVSSDGGTTWAPAVMTGTFQTGQVSAALPSPYGTLANASHFTHNGIWRTDDNFATTPVLFRVRCVSLESGSPTLEVGHNGTSVPGRGTMGDFPGGAKRLYTRVLFRVSPNWDDSYNSGTKFFFTKGSAGANHFAGLTEIGRVGQASGFGYGTQGGLHNTMYRSANNVMQAGVWYDMELLCEANTPGLRDGVLRMWVDGVERLHVTDVGYFRADQEPAVFTHLWLDPTYGGGDSPAPHHQWFQVAAWYRESTP